MKKYRVAYTKRLFCAGLACLFLLSAAGCSGGKAGGTTADNKNADSKTMDSKTGGPGASAVPEEKKSPAEEEEEYADLDTEWNTYMEARFTEDRKMGFIPLDNGQCIQIAEKEGITFAAISPNRRHIVVLLDNDELYVTDGRQKNKQVVSKNCKSSRVYPSDEAISFQEEINGEKHFLRYTFADGKAVDLGACTVGRASENGTAEAGISDGALCLLTADSGEVVRYPGVGHDEIRLLAVSDDGSAVIWTEETDNFLLQKLYTLGADGTAQLLGDITVRGMASANFSKDEQLLLVTSEQVNHLYLRDGSGQWKRVELPGDLKNETAVYQTDAGLLHQVNADEIHYIYLRCGNQLCALSTDGTVTVVRSSVRDFDILDGMLYYSDTQKDIYASKLSGTEVTEETLLLQGVDAFAVSESGNYLYSFYVHPEDEKVRSVSAYPLHEEHPAETMLTENIQGDANVFLSADDDRVFFVDDFRKAGENNYMGTLRVYHGDRKETEIIDEDVYRNTLINGKDYVLVSEYAQSTKGIGKFVSFHGDLMYKKKPEANTDGYVFDWYYYDGAEPVCMASDLDY